MSRFVPVSFEKWGEMVKARSDLVRYKEMCNELDAECTRLKAEVERLTALVESNLNQSKRAMANSDAYVRSLEAQVERLDTLCKQLSRQHSDISCENIMLRKAGDAMASTLKDGGIIVSGYALADEWLKAKLLAAKEGKQS
jgi:hypothetical protein